MARKYGGENSEELRFMEAYRPWTTRRRSRYPATLHCTQDFGLRSLLTGDRFETMEPATTSKTRLARGQ